MCGNQMLGMTAWQKMFGMTDADWHASIRIISLGHLRHKFLMT